MHACLQQLKFSTLNLCLRPCLQQDEAQRAEYLCLCFLHQDQLPDI